MIDLKDLNSAPILTMPVRKSRSSLLASLFGAAAICLCFLGGNANAQAQAQTLTVTTSGDDASASPCASGSCTTLRDAITQANNDNTKDTIVFSSSLKLPAVITLTSDLPTITTSLTIQGPGANLLTISGGGTGVGTEFFVGSGYPTIAINVVISGLTIANANSQNGGGLQNYGSTGGSLTIEGCAFTGNVAEQGGGIYNYSGTLIVSDSTFSGNSTANSLSNGPGGGIYNGSYGTGYGYPAGNLTVVNSTFYNNSANQTSYGQGGAIFNDTGASATVINSTISGNSANDGGGISNAGTLTLVNSIVSGNTAISNADLGGYTDNGTSGNEIGISAINLAKLGYYGGATQTMPPLTGSYALNSGIYQAGVVPGTDQRGEPRPTKAGEIDSGSVQVSNEPAVITSVSPSGGPLGGGTSVTITGTGLDNVGAVSFGATPANSVTINPATTGVPSSVTVISPAATTAGMVDVTVNNGSGNSATGSSDQFTYYVPTSITISLSNLSATYDGKAQAVSVTTSPANVAVTVTYNGSSTVPVNAGSYTVVATSADPNYSGSATGTLVISPATPSVLWSAPSAILYGTKLSSAQLDATSSAAGTFTYTPPAGTLLSVGQHVLTVSFTPSDTVDYSTPAPVSVNLVVSQAVLSVTAANASRVYGTANPTFTGTVSGAVNGDTFTESFSTSATNTSNAGSYAIVPSVTGTNVNNYSVNISDGTLTITPAATTTTITSSSSTFQPGQSLTLTAQVKSATTGTPTGSVSFYDGSTLLGTASLGNGAASYTVSSLAAGATHSFTAAYAGSTNFAASTSSSAVSVTVPVLDFTLTPSGAQSVTITSGQAASYAFKISPTAGVYPAAVAFSTSGLPQGAVATFSPVMVAANGGTATVTLTVTTVASTAKNSLPAGGAPLALGFLLLPMLGVKRTRKGAVLVLTAVAVLAGFVAMSGCGTAVSSNQTSGPQNYTMTVTGTSGQVQHSFNVDLTLQ